MTWWWSPWKDSALCWNPSSQVFLVLGNNGLGQPLPRGSVPSDTWRLYVFFRAVVQLSSPGSAPSPTPRWLPTMSPALMMELLNWCLWFQSCIFNHSNTLSKVSMGEDVLTNGRPADGIYFLTTNREEPRSYNSYEQWTENWNVWNMNSFRRFQHLHKSAFNYQDRQIWFHRTVFTGGE